MLAFAAPAAQADNYVALGDSFASGSGTTGPLTDGQCDRHSTSYPNILAIIRPFTNLSFAACGGATTDTLMNSQIQSVNYFTNRVTVQIGGNDSNFGGLVIQCMLLDCRQALVDAQNSIRATLPAKLDRVYSAIKTRAPNAKVIVVGYPSLADPGSPKCAAAPGIELNEIPDIVNTAYVLRDTIKARALAYGFKFADAVPAFAGHGVCSSDPWINGLTLNVTPFHPNDNGQRSGYTALVYPFMK